MFWYLLSLCILVIYMLASCSCGRDAFSGSRGDHADQFYVDHKKSRAGGGKPQVRTKSEQRVITYFENIVGKSFPTAHPSWLVRHGRKLELDGYCKSEKIAVEFSGPLHTKWTTTYESYARYYERLCKDVFKKICCRKHGVRLITVDMTHDSLHFADFVRSRLADIGFCERPQNYIPHIEIIPYRSSTIERELGLTELDKLLAEYSGQS